MQRWSEEEVNYVKQLAALGVSYTEMSEYLDRTPKSIQLKMQKLGFVFNDFYTKPEKQPCLNCGGKIENHGKVFCSQSCAATFNNFNRPSKREDENCYYCGQSMRAKRGQKFCSQSCANESKTQERRQLILKDDNSLTSNAYKKFLIEEHGEKCMECGWDKINPITNKCPIELEHIDGDHTNNHLNNLKLLCPNCHSLTPTYKGLNRGNGRHERMKRYRDGKSF